MTLANPKTPNEAEAWRQHAREQRREGYATGYAAGQADAADHLERLAAGCRGRASQVLRGGGGDPATGGLGREGGGVSYIDRVVAAVQARWDMALGVASTDDVAFELHGGSIPGRLEDERRKVGAALEAARRRGRVDRVFRWRWRHRRGQEPEAYPCPMWLPAERWALQEGT